MPLAAAVAAEASLLARVAAVGERLLPAPRRVRGGGEGGEVEGGTLGVPLTSPSAEEEAVAGGGPQRREGAPMRGSTWPM